MNKQPRRRFLKQLGTAGAAVALTSPALASAQSNAAESCSDLATAVIPLESWAFALDPAAAENRRAGSNRSRTGRARYRAVTVPHTWQVSAETAEYMGVGWYWTEFDAPSHWAGRCVRIEFEAVFHTAKVWLNGQLLGEHPGRGYTAFTFDATPALRFDGRNFLAVKVDNSFNGRHASPQQVLRLGSGRRHHSSRKFARYPQLIHRSPLDRRHTGPRCRAHSVEDSRYGAECRRKGAATDLCLSCPGGGRRRGPGASTKGRVRFVWNRGQPRRWR